jgi:hypothetical protein
VRAWARAAEHYRRGNPAAAGAVENVDARDLTTQGLMIGDVVLPAIAQAERAFAAALAEIGIDHLIRRAPAQLESILSRSRASGRRRARRSRSGLFGRLPLEDKVK